MIKNILFKVCFVILSVSLSISIKVGKKGYIVTPTNSNSQGGNGNSWPLPFFTDNQSNGFISTYPSSIVTNAQSLTTYAPPVVTTTTSGTNGSVKIIISSPASIEIPQATSLPPLVTVINPSMMINYSIFPLIRNTSPTQSTTKLGPLVTVIDPQFFISPTTAMTSIFPNNTLFTNMSLATTTILNVTTETPYTSNPFTQNTNYTTTLSPLNIDGNLTLSVANQNKTFNDVTDSPDYDSEAIEILSADSSNTIPYQINYFKNNLNISDPHINTGWSTLTPSAMMNKISEEKCNEYFSGKRPNRASSVQVFIIGGQSSSQKEFPHMAALGYGPKSSTNNQWLCGGSLISDYYVVTAAHCLYAKNLGYVSFVRLGTTTLQTETLQSEDYDVVSRIAHPNYIDGKQYNDIALLKLNRPVTFNEYISPICLYTSTDLNGKNLIATGWGKTSNTGSIAKDLQKVNLNYVPNNVCQQAYSAVPKDELKYGIVDATQICAGSADGSKDTCQGDSGGPLLLQANGKMYLVGITSFGIGCGPIPGVYTRVSYYVPWIEQVVWK